MRRMVRDGVDGVRRSRSWLACCPASAARSRADATFVNIDSPENLADVEALFAAQPPSALVTEASVSGAFDGKVAIVTGASRGIGRAIALELARRGAMVVVRRARAERSGASSTRSWQRAGAPRAATADMTDTASLEALVGGVVARLARIDVLVNNAGITRDQLMLRMKRADWDDVLATNLTAAFTLCQAALKPMIKQRSGRIVAISSVVGQSGNAGQANYAASKAGLIGFCKSLAREVASRNVTVNVVAPGLIDTDMTRAADRGSAEGLVGADSARATGHAGRCRGGRVLSRLRRGVVYYRTGSGRQWRHVHVDCSAKCGVRSAESVDVRSA